MVPSISLYVFDATSEPLMVISSGRTYRFFLATTTVFGGGFSSDYRLLRTKSREISLERFCLVCATARGACKFIRLITNRCWYFRNSANRHSCGSTNSLVCGSNLAEYLSSVFSCGSIWCYYLTMLISVDRSVCLGKRSS